MFVVNYAILCVFAISIATTSGSNLRRLSGYSVQLPPPPPAQSSYQSSYSAPPAQQNSYAAAAPAAQAYGTETHSYTSPTQSYYQSQPAIQQLIQNMINQYHGYGAVGSTIQEPVNTCAVGYVQTIYENNQVSETYCRCPTGTYGFTCTENFANPCVDGSVEYANADQRIPPNYFIKCSWGIPYLNKCPAGTTKWSQELYTCVSDGHSATTDYGTSYGGSPAPAPSQSVGGYGSPTITRPITQSLTQSSSYGAQPQVQLTQSPSYGAQPQVQLTQSPSYGAQPQVQLIQGTGGYGSQVQPQVQQSQGGYGGQQTVVSQSQGSSY